MRNPEYYVAVYGILENEEGEVLFLQRKNTGFMDWRFGLPAWHLEWFETLKQWVQREILEEIWIEVSENNLELIHSSHRINFEERVYFDFYFKIHKYSWEIRNWEPEKCSEIKFLKKDDVNIVPYLWKVFKRMSDWEKFSEIFINKI